MKRIPVRKSILATTTALAATYTKIGSAINVEGMVDLCLHIAETGGAEGALVKIYSSLSGSAPTTNSGMYQDANTDGTEKVYTIAASGIISIPINISAKYLLLYAAGASGGTNASITCFITGSRPQPDGLISKQLNSTVLSAASLTSASLADKGVAVNIEGYSDLTLHLSETVGTEGAKVRAFVAHTGSAPTATAALHTHSVLAGTAVDNTVLKGEKASFALKGLTGKYLMIQAAKTAVGAGNATLAVTITGSLTNQ